MKKKIQHIIVVITLSGSATYAQVGIGNAVPHGGAILDLNNTEQKGLALPVLSTPADDTIGLVYFDIEDSVVKYYEGSIGYNGLSPWKYKYNGSISSDTYYQQGGNVGIGITAPPTKLTIDGGTDAQGSTGNNGFLLIGDFSAGHMLLDDDEIIVKSDGNTSSTLLLQNDGGTVSIGASTTANLTVNGNVNTTARIQEDNNDLLPAGTICMWAGTSAPLGWGLCNGSTYTKTDGGSLISPDLRGLFIAGYDPTDTDYDNIADAGGETTHVLTTAEMPSHVHTGTTNNDGLHTHTAQSTLLTDNDDNDDTGYYVGYSGGADPQTSTGSGHTITSSGSAHTHNFTTNSNGSNTAHENRPEFYTLAYIIKL